MRKNVHLCLQVFPRCLWFVEQHIRIELAPTDLADKTLVDVMRVRFCEQLAWMHQTETKIWRHHARAINTRRVSIIGIASECSSRENIPSLPCSFLACYGKRMRSRFDVWQVFRCNTCCPTCFWSLYRICPSNIHPTLEVWRENSQRCAVIFEHHPGINRIWRSNSSKLYSVLF